MRNNSTSENEVLTPEVSTTKLPTAPAVAEDNAMVLAVKSSGLEKTQAQQFLDMFTPFLQNLAEIESDINSINAENPSKEDVAKARAIRLKLKSNRVASDKVKTDAKASILVKGRLIDNLNGIVTNTSKPLESKCEAIEKFAELQEEKRIAELRESRAADLRPYVNDEGVLASLPLGTLSDDAWSMMLEGYRKAYNDRLESERKAEAERLAKEKADEEARVEKQRLQDEENERIRIENERLKAEADEREKALAAERAAADEARRVQEAKHRAEREEQDRLLEEQRAKADAERLERERIEAEQRAKQEAEEKAERDRIEAEETARQIREEEARLAALAPEKDKLTAWVNGFTNSASFPACTSNAAVAVETDIAEKFSAFIDWANTRIATLQ